MTITLTQWIILVTAIIVLATKIIELALSSKKSRTDATTPIVATTSSTKSRKWAFLSDVFILVGWGFGLFHLSSASRPVTTADLALVLVLVPAMIVLLRR